MDKLTNGMAKLSRRTMDKTYFQSITANKGTRLPNELILERKQLITSPRVKIENFVLSLLLQSEHKLQTEIEASLIIIIISCCRIEQIQTFYQPRLPFIVSKLLQVIPTQKKINTRQINRSVSFIIIDWAHLLIYNI